VRPRTSPLLREVETSEGVRHVWCTFSHDQIDLNFRNPEVLKRMVEIVRHYLDQRRAHLPPRRGCVSVEGTGHDQPQSARDARDYAPAAHAGGACPTDAVLITETNIPNQENLSYFGNANEAHCVYNFSLPPLLLNTLVTGDCCYLKQWMMSMPPPQHGTAYFNFIASHDGIGLRPAEGLLSDEELQTLISTMRRFGGARVLSGPEGGENKPYEINIALFDALQGTVDGPDEFGVQRFLCAHAIMLGLEGIPGHLYPQPARHAQRLRAPRAHGAEPRHQPPPVGSTRSSRRGSRRPREYTPACSPRSCDLLAMRQRQAAFHPNATQFTLHLGNQLFGFWRQSADRRQSIFCVSNISREPQTLQLSDINLIEASTGPT
jgi:sucrose phosphorylase